MSGDEPSPDARHGGALDQMSAPFVLLEDRLRAGAFARLYVNPVAIVRCDTPEEIDDAFARIEAGVADGLHAAGFLSYELGHALEPRLASRLRADRDMPLLWFGLFAPPRRIAADALDRAFAERGPPPPITGLTPTHDRATHLGKVRKILQLIRAGDVYQVNLTFPLRFRHAGDPLALYGALRSRQPVAHGGVVAFGDATLLSVSPELFVEVAEGQATTRPMKGTAPRCGDERADAAVGRALAANAKQRAENLMIVDLLRNDLARVSEPGSVRTSALFAVESYPTFHALTSTITARLRAGVGLRGRMRALFPCGSIVGAPKIRAAEVIGELEAEARGVYSGAIGAIGPGGRMAFNVAIRTAVIRADGAGRYDVGGGVVADSDPDEEYDEAILKARVLSDLADDYGLIETFRWSATEGFVRLAGHLGRLQGSAGRLGFALDRAGLAATLAERARGWRAAGGDRRVRLELSRLGDVQITGQAIAAAAPAAPRLQVSRRRLDRGDPFLRHKTTRRETHEEAYAEAVGGGFDEALLLNRQGRVADGSRNSVFAEFGGRLVTPPLAAGALPGVLRAELIAVGRAVEGDLGLADLARCDRLFVGNSLNGLRCAQLAPPFQTD